MIYKMNKVSNIESFNPDKVLDDLLQGYSSLVIILTEKIDLNKLDYIFLTNEQIQHLEKIVVPNDKVNYLISHSIVNIFYCNLMKCSIEELKYYYNSYSKPYIKNMSHINFNISHTSGCSVIAFSHLNIGIDVENIERKISFGDIIDYYFCDYEKNYINRESIKFFECWVAKEAYLKCTGYGLVKGLKNAHINLINSNYFEIINKDTYLSYIIYLEYIHLRYVIGVTTSEVKDE